MAFEYPFRDFTLEIKPRVPGVAAAGEFDNIKQSFRYGKIQIVETVGQAVWDRMISYYNATFDPVNPGVTDDDLLVLRIQDAMIFFVYAHHFIFLEIEITDEGVTVPKSSDKTSAFKYQTDKAELAYIQNAWINSDELIKFLVAAGLPEWDFSSQRQEIRNLFFKSYMDFQKYYDIDNSAYFFINARQIITLLTRRQIKPRVNNMDVILKEYHDNALTDDNEERLFLIQEAIAYETMGISASRFGYFKLPGSIRGRLTADRFSTVRDADEQRRIRENISNDLMQQAQDTYKELEELIKQQEEVAAITEYDDTIPEATQFNDENKPYYFTPL